LIIHGCNQYPEEELSMNIPRCWKNTLSGILLVTLLSVAIFFTTWQSIVDIWLRSKTFNHGFIIAPISIWLIWQQRHRLQNLSPEFSWLAIATVFGTGLAWLAGDLTNTLIVKQYAVVAMLIGGYWALLGNRITARLLFPLGFLLLMVPAGESVIPPLMEYTATFTVFLLRLTGITVYREGLNFTLTTGSWSVVEACSGINSLISTITIGAVYAYLTFTRYWKRALFMLLCIVLPIIANGFRAYTIVMLGHLSDMQLAVGFDHFLYGGVFFMLVMLILFYIGSLWRDIPRDDLSSRTIPEGTTVSGYSTGQLLSMLMIIGLVYAIWPAGAIQLKSMQQDSGDLALGSTTLLQQGWITAKNPHWSWAPHFQGATSAAMTYFHNGTDLVGLYQANFGKEIQGGAELVNSQHVLLDKIQKGTWRVIHRGTIQLPRNHSGSLLVNESILRSSRTDLVVLRWYQIGDKNTANPYLAKWLQLVKRLTGDTSPELLMLLLTAAPADDYSDSRARLQKFARSWFQQTH